eukprot:gnl/TRDRNA2_/TRDRNA2_177253_c9_seq31.p1 gnl/TRDRNA2_/TRDRNA2_177253_c9~~gnl/TRDRNA2_/TRDRNA2_177253_c9_seq31.p1  ORF type:complete len:530 (-),score=98.75 gnl/TRDRNA2_/TRDRNA2_177253_c9_seq31:285-1829(-)
MALVDQLHNLYFMMQLFMNVYLVDFVLNPEQEAKDLLFGNKETLILVMMAMLVGPHALLHYLDYRKFSWKVGGLSRNTLQGGLMRKFLNYDEESRNGIEESEIVMAMTTDAVDIVHKGYINMLAIVRALGQLFMILLYQCIAPFLFDKEFRIIMFVPLAMFPVVLFAFLVLRKTATTDCLVNRNAWQVKMVDRINRTVANYRLLADYNQRGFFVHRFEECIQEFNKTATVESKVLENNKQFVGWITILWVAGYTFFAGLQVINGKVTLGMFLTDIKVLSQIGASWGGIYMLCLQMQTAFPALERITRLLNLPVDVAPRRDLAEHNQNESTRLRGELLKEHEKHKDDHTLPVDLLPIHVANLKVKVGQSHVLNFSRSMKIKQGEFVALVGPPGEGKSTMLKILGGVSLPKLDGEDTFFIPSHLRVLHVSEEKLFFSGTLLANLTFGCATGDSDGEMERVVSICKKTGLAGACHGVYRDRRSSTLEGHLVSYAVRHVEPGSRFDRESRGADPPQAH